MDKHGGGGGGGGLRRVVVVGGGIAGSLLAKSLQFFANVTLIDPKEYLEIPYGSLRSTVEPSFAERSLIKHSEYFSNGRLITSPAVDITESQVLVANGRHVDFDFLVVATGHDHPLPTTRDLRLQHYRTENERIREANSILIIGGGPSGVELAGEIATDFRDKAITLVHDGPRLLEFMGPKASDKALKWLISRRVAVKLDQKIDLNNVSEGTKTFRSSKGETIRADCHFVCTGKPVGSAWLHKTMLKTNLDRHGRLMVDGNLRVKGRHNIFAIGDITNIRESKQGESAKRQARVAAKNMKMIMVGKEGKMEIYRPPSSTTAIVSLGRKQAVAQFSLTTITGTLPGFIKSRDLFVGKARKHLGLHPTFVDSF
ncbi:apoptosis-inducing factor 2-like [Cucurbita pepo subsp. pepo]|uniref:apoptosis-inducing factor 2-like n=1 Tax=Cucurbita pepo subsp. pepo TaxID=3664 RepID=UPI000C9D8EF4|nr:apoptosis-inducing factor 2-like [Cucurbita pepo subsp. pepo]